jgi:putative transposase
MATQTGGTRYSSDLTDDQWNVLEPLVPQAKSNDIIGGAPEVYPKQEIMDGILYVKTNGCKWKDMPTDLPPPGICYHYFNTWSKNGTWYRIHEKLRTLVRKQAGKSPQPTAAIIDSQSAKTAGYGGICGYDAGKKIKGRKRHIIVDTLGLLLGLHVHAANIQDRDGAKVLIMKVKNILTTLELIWADGGYRGQLIVWVKETTGWVMEIVKRNSDMKGFEVLPKRWIVERTFGWLSQSRRLAKDYEVTIRNSQAMIRVAMIHLMTKRIAQKGVI